MMNMSTWRYFVIKLLVGSRAICMNCVLDGSGKGPIIKGRDE